MVARRKHFLGDTWTLTAGHVTAAQLEAVKRMQFEFKRQHPEESVQLERDVEAGLSRFDD